MGNRSAVLTDGALFSLSVLITSGTQFFTFPVLIFSLGAQEWAGLTVGTIMGTLAAVIGGWGLSSTGAATVASLDSADRFPFYCTSMIARVPTTLLAFALVTIAVVSVPTATPSATWIAAAASLTSLSLVSGWFFVGQRMPSLILINLTLPNVIGILLGTFLAFTSGDPRLHAGANLCGALGSLLMTHYAVTAADSRSPKEVVSRQQVGAIWRSQSSHVGVGLLTSVNQGLPLIAMAQWFPHGLPAYALTERLYRLAQAVSSPVTHVMHGIVPTTSRNGTIARMWQLFRLLILLALALGTGFTILVPWAANLYTGGQITVGLGTALAFGAALTAFVVSSTVGVTALAITGDWRWYLRSGAVSATVSLICITLAVRGDLGAPGVAAAFACSEMLMTVVQALRLRSLHRSNPSSEPSAAHGGSSSVQTQGEG